MGMEYGGDEEQDGPPLEIGQRGLSQYREDGRPDTKLTRHNDDLDGDDGQYDDGHPGGDHGEDYPAFDYQRDACSLFTDATLDPDQAGYCQNVDGVAHDNGKDDLNQLKYRNQQSPRQLAQGNLPSALSGGEGKSPILELRSRGREEAKSSKPGSP